MNENTQKGLLKSLDRNSLVTVFTDPIRMVSLSLAMYFIMPYIFANGLNEVQFGNAQSIANLFSLILSFFSAAIINKLGRKWTTLLFLDLPFLFALVCIAFGTGYISIILFAICGISLPAIGYTAYSLLRTEDATKQNRIFVVGCTVSIPMAAGLLYPLVGVLINNYDTNRALRMLFSVCIVLFIVNFIMRIKFYRETKTGVSVKSNRQNVSIIKELFSYICNIPVIISNPRYVILLLMYFVNTAVKYMSMVYPAYILGKALITDAQYSNLAIGTAILTLIGNFVIIPIMSKRNTNSLNVFLISCIISAGLLFTFTFVGEGEFIMLFIINSVYGLSSFFVFSLSNVLIVNTVPGEICSDVYSTIQVVTNLLMIPVPALYGQLLARNLDVTIYVCCGIWVLGALFALILAILNKKIEKTEHSNM